MNPPTSVPTKSAEFTPCPKPERSPRKPKTAVKKQNRKRKASEFARCYHSKERVEFVRALPCILTGMAPCDVVHVVTGGVSRKADSCYTVPMIRAKHRELHQIGVQSFEGKYGVSLMDAALQTEKAWLAAN